MAAVVAFLRRTLTLAAVVAVQLDSPTWRPNDVHSASIWRSLGVHLEFISRPENLQLAQEAPKRPKWSPRGAQKAPR